ncbi:MAG TPA: leucyl aminopeptidase [Xanthomonadales bacterium]|nr:leucyl aminopeptidase [Xanthomonadales bacterium]
MNFSLSKEAVSSIETPCLAISVSEDGPLSAAAAALDEASHGTIRRMLQNRDISAAIGKTTLLHGLQGVRAERVLVLGLGKMAKLDRSRFDRACLAAGKALSDLPLTQCHVCLHDLEFDGADFGWRLRQAALATYRANYRYTTTKPPRDDSPPPLQGASFQAGAQYQSAIDQAAAMGKGFHKARELGDLPPNICNPAYLAQEARAIAREFSPVELEILEEEQMAELGMDALLGVSRGSANPPRLIVMKYFAGTTGEPPVVLVGKGITFDSGGLSMKSPENMVQMKYDMCGAASVMGAFLACVSTGLRVNVVCVVAAAENMPDGNAYRPGDVVTSMSGKTIEVLNTDAEGRMVLCDALSYSERFKPKAIIDVATLTGACVIALGHHASGLFSNDENLANDLLAAGEDVVDRAWRLPLWDDYQAQLESPVADMQNVGGMPAGAVTAACFLSRFAEQQRWAHLDIAGSAWKWNEKEGATGRPVGLLCRYLMAAAAGENA